MRQAVIVSTARSPIGRAYKGALNNLEAPSLGGHSVAAAVQRAGLEGQEVDDVIMGSALTQGSGSMNIGRLAGLAGGLPVTVSGMTLDR
ncbi:MAG: acetyl-CoA C-acyltransferase, partial [Alteromonas sp.]